jgi:hypothetical protein
MFGNFFNSTEVDKYADWIVEEVKRLLPPGSDPDKESIGRRAEKLHERIDKRTIEFTQQTSLNIYKKARLAARVREGMSAHGYAAPFVKSFSYDLLAKLQMAASQPKR